MTRYFFHLDECGLSTRDLEGQDLPDIAAARQTAIVAARAIMCEEISEGRICFSCQIDVTDDHNESLLKVPFYDAVDISGLSLEKASNIIAR